MHTAHLEKSEEVKQSSKKSNKKYDRVIHIVTHTYIYTVLSIKIIKKLKRNNRVQRKRCMMSYVAQQRRKSYAVNERERFIRSNDAQPT